MPNGSSASLAVKWNNEAAVERALRVWARRIGDQRPEVRRIIWFGSRVNGIPAPGSDVDLCLVLTHSDKPFRERIGDYLPFGFPVGLDLVPLHAGRARTPAAGAPVLAPGDDVGGSTC